MSRWYNPIACAHTVEDPLVTGVEDFAGMDTLALRVGQAVTGWDARSWLRPDRPSDDGEPDDVLQVHLHRVPVYSRRLRDALAAAGISGIQYLPVQVLHYDGTVAGDFAIANILHVVDALDLAQSKYTVYGDDRPDRKGQMRSIWRPVLKAEAVADYDIVRLKGYPIYVCVSERFKGAFEQGGFTGYSFQELALS